MSDKTPGMPIAAALAAQEPERDLSNALCVGRRGDGLVTVALPQAVMSRERALVHAAWLVLVADGELEIGGILAAIGGAS